MIARVWKEWTKVENGDAYEILPQEVVYPELQTIDGYLGGYILRNDSKEEAEFVAVNLFKSLDAVKVFASFFSAFSKDRNGFYIFLAVGAIELSSSFIFLPYDHRGCRAASS